jgi:hypothetical protein
VVTHGAAYITDAITDTIKRAERHMPNLLQPH